MGAGGGCLDIFTLLVCHFPFLSPSLWETARYRLKYCLKGPLSPKQPTVRPSTYPHPKKKYKKKKKKKSLTLAPPPPPPPKKKIPFYYSDFGFIVKNIHLLQPPTHPLPPPPPSPGDGRVVRRSWVNFQCRCVLQFGL